MCIKNILIALGLICLMSCSSSDKTYAHIELDLDQDPEEEVKSVFSEDQFIGIGPEIQLFENGNSLDSIDPNRQGFFLGARKSLSRQTFPMVSKWALLLTHFFPVG